MLGSVRQTEERESESEEGRGARKEGHRPLAGREEGGTGAGLFLFCRRPTATP